MVRVHLPQDRRASTRRQCTFNQQVPGIPGANLNELEKING